MAVKVKGLQKALRDLDRKNSEAVKAVVEVLAETADAIDFDAKTLAPSQIEGKDLNIKQRIDKVPSNGGLRWSIGIQGTQDFDAYVEFGTGLSAKEILYGPGYTKEMREIALEFYKNGRGTLVGSPFLMPSWIKNTANLVEEIKKEIANKIK